MLTYSTEYIFLGWKQDDKNNNIQPCSRPGEKYKQKNNANSAKPGVQSHKSPSPSIKFKNVKDAPKSPNPSLSLSLMRDSRSPSLSWRRSRTRSKSPNPSMSSITLSIASTSRMMAYTDTRMRGGAGAGLTRRFSERHHLRPPQSVSGSQFYPGARRPAYNYPPRPTFQIIL